MRNILFKTAAIVILVGLIFASIYIVKIYQKEDSKLLWPEKFFDFGYELESLKDIHDSAMKILSKNNQNVRFCGSFFDVYDSRYKLQPGEIGGCAEFGTGESRIIRTKDDVQTKEVGDDQDKFLVHIKTDRAYKIKDFSLELIDTGDYNVGNDTDICRISITNSTRSLFSLSKEDFRCGHLSSIEYGDDILLIIQDYAPKGNQYTGDSHILFIQEDKLFDIGTIDTDWYGGGLQAKDFWVNNSELFLTFYDGRYGWKYGQSHNSSTYSFIPRVFKITSHNDSVLLSEGTKVSDDIKNIFTHQLNAIRTSFSKVSTSTHDASTINAFIPYWIGISRYVLTGDALSRELESIKNDIAKINSSNFSIKPSEVDTIYTDIISQEKVIKSL